MLIHQIKMPVQKRSIERLEKVVETTILMLETQSIEQCSIQEISTLSGVPRNYIYQYFPTINHLFSLIVSRYFAKLRSYLISDAERYRGWLILDIIEDILAKACRFYNENKVASILILGGPVNIDGFSLQEMVIDQISEDLIMMLKQISISFALQNQNSITLMIELMFALMKRSFYHHGKITIEIQKEILLVCEAYLEKKSIFL